MKLDEIRKLIEAATPGPWANPIGDDIETLDGVPIGNTSGHTDAAFIAAMGSMAPKLLAVAEASHWLLGALSRADDQHEIASHEQTLREALAALEAPNE